MSICIRVRWVAVGLLAILAPAARAADVAAVDRAIARGADYLKQSQTKEGFWTRPANGTTGATALAGLALLECGVSADDPTVQRAAEALREAAIPVTDTYSIALGILFFDRLGDAGDVPLIESLTVRLLAGQTADGGWTYECPSIGESEVHRLRELIKVRSPNGRKQPLAEKRPTLKDLPLPIQQQLLLVEQLRPGAAAVLASDNSNTQFATLALWVGHRYGPPVNRAFGALGGTLSEHAKRRWGLELRRRRSTPGKHSLDDLCRPAGVGGRGRHHQRDRFFQKPGEQTVAGGSRQVRQGFSPATKGKAADAARPRT